MEQMPKQNPEENVAVLRYLQQLYQNQYNAVVSEMNRDVEYIRELNNAQLTLEKSSSISKKNSVIHLGAGIYISANINKIENVMLEIGAGYILEKSVDEAKQFIASRIEKLTSIFNNLVKNRKELEKAIIEVSYRLEALSAG